MKLFFLYAIGVFTAFGYWFKLLLQDSTTSNFDRTSWIVLLGAAAIWPVSVPSSLLELVLNRSAKFSSGETQVAQHSKFSDLPQDLLPRPPIGNILKTAGLLSEAQVATALKIQQSQDPPQKLGMIIANHGWLSQETIDFFAEELHLQNHLKLPLGQCLRRANLLKTHQIDLILEFQHQSGLRFGEIAVHKGWVKQETINLILQNSGQ
ncbi:MAG: hypothetical protein ACRC8A_14875 [Microcoleaceae cyanobacterium]